MLTFPSTGSYKARNSISLCKTKGALVGKEGQGSSIEVIKASMIIISFSCTVRSNYLTYVKISKPVPVYSFIHSSSKSKPVPSRFDLFSHHQRKLNSLPPPPLSIISYLILYPPLSLKRKNTSFNQPSKPITGYLEEEEEEYQIGTAISTSSPNT